MGEMKAKDQVKHIRSNMSVSNHRFFNMIVAGVQQHLEDSVPGLKLKQSASSLTKTGGTIILTGQMPVADETEKESADTKVRQTMNGLKNPTDLLSTIK